MFLICRFHYSKYSLSTEIMSIDEIEKQNQSKKSNIITVSLFCCSPSLLYKHINLLEANILWLFMLRNSSFDINSEDQNLIASNRRHQYVSNLYIP